MTKSLPGNLTGNRELVQGVRMYSPYPAGFRDRVVLSDGVMLAKGADRARPPYTEDAVVPKGNWRPCTDDEWQVLSTGGAPTAPLSQYVAVIRCPQPVLAPLLDIGQMALRTPYAAMSHNHAERVHMALQGLMELFTAHGVAPDSVQPLGLSLKRPGQATTTINDRKRRRIGLHLDRWDRLPLADTSTARIRLNVNVGSASRYLLFVNLPAKAMATYLSNPQTAVADVGRTFLAENPEYPIVRLRVDPGDAYIAPTDYLIHDATTMDVTSRWDVHFSILARFDGVTLLEMAV